MKRITVIALAISALVIAAGMTAAEARNRALLDGKSFEVVRVREGAKSGEPDTLSFADGMFDSTASHGYGFRRSAYTARSAADIFTFEVHATAKDRSKELWRGTVEGSTIYGTVKLTTPDGAVTRYSFRGERVIM
jgi:hypothetical protein